MTNAIYATIWYECCTVSFEALAQFDKLAANETSSTNYCSEIDSIARYFTTLRYMYTLVRAQYTRAGCKNYRVRPVIPVEHLRDVRNSNAVTMDPILNHVWIPMTQDKLVGRLRGLLKEFVKKNQS